MRQYILYGIGICMAAFTGGGCTDNLTQEPTRETGILRLLSVNIPEEAQTKAEVTTSDINQTDSEVGVHVTKVDGTVYDTDASTSSTVFKKGASSWSADKHIGITNTGGTAVAYGFYPAGATVVNEGTNPRVGVTVLAIDKFVSGNQKDYLYGRNIPSDDPSGNDITPTNSSFTLKLDHALAKVSFKILKASDMEGETITLKQLEIVSGTTSLQTGDGYMGLKDGAMDLISSSSIKLTATGNALSDSDTGLALNTTESSPNITCLVAPMTKQESVLSFNLSVKIGDETRVFVTKSATAVQWLKGQHYLYTITIKKMGGELTGMKMEAWKNDASQNLNIDISD